MNSLVKQEKIEKFQKTIWNYYKKSQRDMPWRETTDPYRVLVSEVMLQQTQVSRVIPKYEAFLKTFPTVEELARAPQARVLSLWSGLGYNRRAINLQKCAKEIIEKHKGIFPKTIPELDALSGIGEATAGAIVAYAFSEPNVFIETNIRRVFIHFFFPRAKNVSDEKLLPLIQASVSQKKARDWYYALMDYGAMLKATVPNPNKRSKHYSKQSKFEGSNRQIRGRILKLLVSKKEVSSDDLIKYLQDDRAEKNISDLTREGFVKKIGEDIILA